MIGEAQVWVIYGLAATGLVSAGLFLVNLARAPFLIQRDCCEKLSKQVATLQRQLHPPRRLSLTVSEIIERHAESSELGGGGIVTAYQMEQNAITIRCQNITDSTIYDVSAFIDHAVRITENGREDLDISPQIELCWDRTGELPAAPLTLSPHQSRDIYLFAVRPRRLLALYRSTSQLNRLDGAYHQMFRGTDVFEVSVTVYARDINPARIRFEIQNRNEDGRAHDLSHVQLRLV